MAHTIKVLKISEGHSQVENASYIQVLVEVSKDGEIIGERSYGYPLGTTPEELKENFAKIVSTLNSDEEVGQKSLELEESLKSVGIASEALIGLEISEKVLLGDESVEK